MYGKLVKWCQFSHFFIPDDLEKKKKENEIQEGQTRGEVKLYFPIKCHFVVAVTLVSDFFQVSYPFSLPRFFIPKHIKFLEQWFCN